MKKYLFISSFVLLFLYLPQLAFAAACVPTSSGSNTVTFASPTSCTYTVPAYGTMTVTVNGAGGGGGGGGVYEYSYCDAPYNYTALYSAFVGGVNGSAGGSSSFNNSVFGVGGSAGASGDETVFNISCSGPPGQGYQSGSSGSSEGGSGGDSSVTGGGASGGSGGADWEGGNAGNSGGGYTPPTYSGGNGGNGGRATKTYQSGVFSPGTGISIVVGSGGSGGAGGSDPSWGTASPGSNGSNGSITITWTTPAPTCQVTLSPSSYNAPGSATVSWTSSNVDPSTETFYIQWIGSVSSQGSTPQSPGASQTYTGYIKQTSSGTVLANCSYVPASSGGTLTVYPYCSFNGQTVQNTQSVTAYQSATVPYGNTCSSQTRTCSDGTLSGSYAYASCSVNPAASCTLNGVTVQSGQSYNFSSEQTAPQGQLCPAYSEKKTCANGVLSPSDSTYIYASCSCQQYDICTGSGNQTITQINADCSETPQTPACVSPQYCQRGASICQSPAIPSGPYQNGTHMELIPNLLQSGETTQVHWSVEDAQSCTVTGTNKDGTSQSTDTNSPGLWNTESGTETSSPITAQTIYTLSCTAYGSNPGVSESQTVNVTPTYEEK